MFQAFGKGESHIGFRHYNLKKEEIYHSVYTNCNQVFFLLEGNLVVNSSEALGEVVREGEFFLVPMSADMTCKALSACNVVLLFFNQIQRTCEQSYFRELYGLRPQEEPRFQTIAIQKFLLKFITDLITHFKQLIDVPAYQNLKYEEFLYILRTLYPRNEMALFFQPILGKSFDFRRFVMENYLKVKNINDLVALSGLKRKTFDRQFCHEFDVPPYQWILKQKAKHIRYALSETNDQMQEIMRKYGFLIAPHFTRFCKDYFDCTPLELRKRLRLEKQERRY
jgi:AraC-like DNA-binding protein